MKKYCFIFLLTFFGVLTAVGQKHASNSFLAKVKRLNRLMEKAVNYSPEETDSLEINYKITKQLCSLLEDPKSVHYDLDKLLGKRNISIAHSADKRLWFFSWDENTGGSFKSALTVVQYRTVATKPYVLVSRYDDVLNKMGFSSEEAGYDKVVLLPSGKNKQYLCFSSFVGCGTCYTQIAQVVTLTATDIIFQYQPTEHIDDEPQPFCRIDSRMDDVKTFEYDEKSQTFYYEYEPDDYTPVKRDYENPEPPKPVKGSFYWNGKEFKTKESK